ncbi:MAG: UbiH/UbiF/VisC/COQ6 family ubiquinone biosynthesis hydroxylase [Alphaproteobacteria bacterium]
MDAQVIIAGGGLAGLSLATALGQVGIDTIVIEKNTLDNLANEPDGRALAVAGASKYFLMRLGAWQYVDRYGSIDEIHVSDNHAPLFLHFDKVKEGPMGHIVESFLLRRSLTKAMRAQKSVTIMEGCSIKEADFRPLSASVTLDNGQKLTANLVVAAEGRSSPLRQKAGIRLTKWDYGQTAFVFNINHTKPHNNIAIELFRPSGPFALLPLEEPNKGSIVFCAYHREVGKLKNMSDSEFEAKLMELSQGMIGDITLNSQRWAFPLSWQWAHEMIDTRLALVADAAHGMHPIAGQGINMGFRDTAQLAQDIIKAVNEGKDIGDEATLQAYQKARRFDNLQMMLATDGLVKLFSSQFPGVGTARQLGLAAMHKLPLFKQKFVKEAMGISKDMPKMMQPL